MSTARCAACGYLTTAPGHAAACTEPAPSLDDIFRELRAHVTERDYGALRQVTVIPRSELRVCPNCWDDLCEACLGPPCLCACQDHDDQAAGWRLEIAAAEYYGKAS